MSDMLLTSSLCPDGAKTGTIVRLGQQLHANSAKSFVRASTLVADVEDFLAKL